MFHDTAMLFHFNKSAYFFEDGNALNFITLHLVFLVPKKKKIEHTSC
jgi:hypothetical protein